MKHKPWKPLTYRHDIIAPERSGMHLETHQEQMFMLGAKLYVHDGRRYTDTYIYVESPVNHAYLWIKKVNE